MSDEQRTREVFISREPIELYKVLKFEGMVSSGGEAKAVISAGAVRVNGLTESRKRRKITAGDIITFAGDELRIHLQQPSEE
ncbi:MAG: RNA-binding S4 domain-containing protein [Pseudomonadota bacterium]